MFKQYIEFHCSESLQIVVVIFQDEEQTQTMNTITTINTDRRCHYYSPCQSQARDEYIMNMPFIFMSRKILNSYDQLCCRGVTPDWNERGSKDVDANFCGVMDEAGGLQ